MHTVNSRVIIKKKSLANEIIMEGKNTMLLNPKKQGKQKIKNNNKKDETNKKHIIDLNNLIKS